MKSSFFERKVLYLLITLLIGVQFGAFFIQVLNHRRIAENTLQEELQVGMGMVKQILAYRNAELLQTAELLAKDYGFLEAFSAAHQDQETIESVLENHRHRAHASMIILSSLDRHIIAQSPNDLSLAHGTRSADVLSAPQNKEVLQFANLTLSSAQSSPPHLFHIIHSALKAPTHLANLTVGYEVDQAFLKRLHEMTHLELMVLSKPAQSWQLNASTLVGLPPALLAPMLSIRPSSMKQSVEWHGETYVIRAARISDIHVPAVYMVIAKPLSTAMRPYHQIERTLCYLLAASVLVTLAAIVYVTKRFVMPLSQQAFTDHLTGLGNHRLFTGEMERALRQFKQAKIPFVLLMLDLNKFKQINDSLGHDMGDMVLKTVAQRIKTAVRSSDTVARLGGDEYAILLENCHAQHVLQIVELIGAYIAQPMTDVTPPLLVHASIGIAMAQTNDTIDAIVKRADEAMYLAKSQGEMFVMKQ